MARTRKGAGKEPRDTGAPIALDRIALRRLNYREVPSSSPPRPAEGRIGVNLGVDGKLNVMKQGIEIFLDVKIKPDVDLLPYEVEVAFSAFFRRDETVSDTDLLEFAQGPGLHLVYPYIREAVSSITSRGLFGPLWLDPTAFAFHVAAPVKS